MNLCRLVFAVAMPLVLSACMNTCNCEDNQPPRWQTTVDLSEAGLSVPSQCIATMTRGANVIEFDIDGSACARGVDTAPADSGFQVCQSGDSYVAFWLSPDDEKSLGGLDFDFTVTCDGKVVHQSHETFSTVMCLD